MSHDDVLKNVDRGPSKSLFQVRINSELLESANERRMKDKLTWAELIEALFRIYLDDATIPYQTPRHNVDKHKS